MLYSYHKVWHQRELPEHEINSCNISIALIITPQRPKHPHCDFREQNHLFKYEHIDCNPGQHFQRKVHLGQNMHPAFIILSICQRHTTHCQLRARRALALLLLYKVYGISALLIFNSTSLNSVNTLLVSSQRYIVN